MFSRPLEILFLNFCDAIAQVAFRHGAPKYLFVPKRLNGTLGEAARVLEQKWAVEDFDFLILDMPDFKALRRAAHEVWAALDEEHRLPLGDWRDFVG